MRLICDTDRRARVLTGRAVAPQKCILFGGPPCIVFALLEYGIILAILRKKDNSSSMRIPGKKSGKWYHVANLIFTADVLSFLVSLLYFAIFNFVYWQSGIQAWDEHKQQFKTHDEI